MATAKQNAVSLRLNPAIKAPANLQAYVVDHAGKIVEVAPFTGKEAALKSGLNVVQGQHKVYIAPPIPAELAHKANELLLIKGGAHQVQKNAATGNVIDISHLPVNFAPWLAAVCMIQGNVTNTVTVDGKEVTTPLCHARVHIVEVEVEWMLPHVPIFSRIPDWVIKELQNLLPKPAKPDPIGPVAKGIVPGLAKNQTFLASAIHPFMAEKFSLLQAPKGPHAARHFPAEASLPQLPAHVLSGLASPSLDLVRKTLAENAALLHPYFCLWPRYWPWLYKWDEDHLVFTDNNGHFQFPDPIFDEAGQPLNIYIWIEAQQADGQWATVYNPSLPCSTHWNYQCGSPINIALHDANIAPCGGTPVSGDVVWVKRVGDGTSVRTLALEKADPLKPSFMTDAHGMPDARGLAPYPFAYTATPTQWVSPFSGSFPVYVLFGDGFSVPTPDATHFRWKYRRIADADLTPVSEGFSKQQGPLVKPYTYPVTDAHGTIVYCSDVFSLDVTLGSGDKLYKIPNVDASKDTGKPKATWNQDTVTIGVDAAHLPNGLYEYVLELFDSTGNVKRLPTTVFQLDPLAPATLSEPAEHVDGQYIANDADSYGFRFLLRIDHDATHCGIYDAVVLNHGNPVATTDHQCGFAQYPGTPADNSMRLSFFADQPHRYAEYQFTVTRGNGNDVPNADTANKQVPASPLPPAPPTTIVVNDGLADMLNGCPRAAFAEVLHVRGYHTNGSTRLDWYDSNAVAAFAVEPV